jgi:purine-binding chemotaxis protein CheW
MAVANSRQWLIFELADQAYGFDVSHVREIVSLRDMHVHRMPESPALIDGVVLLRDRPIEVMDVRLALGLCSLHTETEEIAKILQEREADHCRWIEELEACVDEQREFRLATDPHKCKFGQWYDKLSADPRGFSRLTNNELALTSLFEQLDQPHRRIHAVAQRVLSHATAGRMSEAKRVIEETRNTELQSMRRLFAKCREQIEIARRGVLFVLAEEDSVFGGLVDRVFEVVTFPDGQIKPVQCAGLAKDTLVGVAQWRDTGRMVQLLNVPAMARLRRSHPNPSLSCPT